MAQASFWSDTVTLPQFPALDRSLTVDGVVVGAGLTGVSAAYLLKSAGLRVALIERGRCGGIDSRNTTAHLTCVTDLRLHKLVRSFGKDRARAVWEAGSAAIDQIVTNITREEIACDFAWVPGYLFAALDGHPADIKTLQRDARLARELGFVTDYVEAVPYVASPGLRFAHQARFHPLKYLRGLLAAIPGGGSHVFERTEATEFHEKPMAVSARGNKIRCRYVVLATHTPLMGQSGALPATLLQTKLYLYTSYALGARLPPNLLPDALYWDTADPYTYIRLEPARGHDYLIFGGEDHKTGQEPHTVAPYDRLELKLRKLFPEAAIDHRWSGQVIETNDGLPFIGETAERQFVATGFAGNGMTFGTLGGMMAVDACLGRKNPWEKLFSPRRKKVRGGTWDYLSENKDYPYYLLRDRLARAEGKSLKAVRRGEGRILNISGEKVAAYRDDNGVVTLCSPVCTHLKCIVAWNEAERTWDCPCHGSRFKPTGEVLAGPAEEDLERVKVDSLKG